MSRYTWKDGDSYFDGRILPQEKRMMTLSGNGRWWFTVMARAYGKNWDEMSEYEQHVYEILWANDPNSGELYKEYKDKP